MKTKAGVSFFFLFVCTLTLAAPTHFHGGTVKACAGGGPVPIKDTPLPKVHLLETQGKVQEFLLWEKKDEVVYRNEKEQINSLSLTSGSNLNLTSSDQPLSRLVDENERYLITRDAKLGYDSTTNQWFQMPMKDGQIAHAYWENESLYSISEQRDSYGRQIFYVHENDYFNKWTRLRCQTTFSANRQIKIAEGHRYPKIYLYEDVPQGDSKTRLTIYEIDHRVIPIPFTTVPCRVSSHKVPDLIEGDIKQVYFYEDHPDAVAAKLENSESNLFWRDGKTCRYYSLGGGPVPISYKAPIFSQWSETIGLQVVHLDVAGSPQVSKGIQLPKLEQRHMWLTRSLQDLFVSPPDSYNGRSLLRLEFEPFEP